MMSSGLHYCQQTWYRVATGLSIPLRCQESCIYSESIIFTMDSSNISLEDEVADPVCVAEIEPSDC